MEDARIVEDYTVRNAKGTILQFIYGEDGFDGAKIETQKLTTIIQSDKNKAIGMPIIVYMNPTNDPFLNDKLLLPQYSFNRIIQRDNKRLIPTTVSTLVIGRDACIKK